MTLCSIATVVYIVKVQVIAHHSRCAQQGWSGVARYKPAERLAQQIKRLTEAPATAQEAPTAAPGLAATLTAASELAVAPTAVAAPTTATTPTTQDETAAAATAPTSGTTAAAAAGTIATAAQLQLAAPTTQDETAVAAATAAAAQLRHLQQ